MVELGYAPIDKYLRAAEDLGYETWIDQPVAGARRGRVEALVYWQRYENGKIKLAIQGDGTIGLLTKHNPDNPAWSTREGHRNVSALSRELDKLRWTVWAMSEEERAQHEAEVQARQLAKLYEEADRYVHQTYPERLRVFTQGVAKGGPLEHALAFNADTMMREEALRDFYFELRKGAGAAGVQAALGWCLQQALDSNRSLRGTMLALETARREQFRAILGKYPYRAYLPFPEELLP